MLLHTSVRGARGRENVFLVDWLVTGVQDARLGRPLACSGRIFLRLHSQCELLSGSKPWLRKLNCINHILYGSDAHCVCFH